MKNFQSITPQQRFIIHFTTLNAIIFPTKTSPQTLSI